MKTYLVGGAVRDILLDRPAKDRDYVVVGATAEEMLEQGFEQVGADFPVFLHPKTKEEHALAREERKVAAGYHGFETNFDPSVTLEEDLVRRDLTINAMALEEGTTTVIDLFGGQKDLKEGVLRHVSEAFAEDPVRVLRVARFRARYNFSVAPETMELMKQLVTSGELDTLVTERVWAEMEKALMEDHPSLFFKTLNECGALERVMPGIGWLNSQLRNLDVSASIDSNLAQRVMVLMAGTTNIKAKLAKMGVPTRMVTLAVKFEQLMENLRHNVFPQKAMRIFKELDLWRRPDDLHEMIRPVLAHNFPDAHRRMNKLVAAHNAASQVSFASLTDEQQKTLKGPAVGEAIDELRLEALKEAF